MNILLQKGYKSLDRDGELIAEEKDGILYLYRSTAFKEVMYEMTYNIYGKTCMYCHKNPATTIDHRIPQDFGGPTITDNLYPTCSKCNNLKSNMYEDEFREFLKLEDKYERAKFVKSLIGLQEDRRFGVVPSLPSEWLVKEKRNVLWVKFYMDEPLGSKYRRIKRALNQNKTFKTSVTYSKNFVVVDGFNVIFLAKEENRKDFDQIWIENLVVLG